MISFGFCWNSSSMIGLLSPLCSMCVLVCVPVSRCLWTSYSQTNKWRGGLKFLLLTFMAHGRNSSQIEVKGDRRESRGQAKSLTGSFDLDKNLTGSPPQDFCTCICKWWILRFMCFCPLAPWKRLLIDFSYGSKQKYICGCTGWVCWCLWF